MSRMAVAGALVALVVLSGCIGGGDKKAVASAAPTGGPINPVPTTTAVVDCAADGDASDCAGVSDALRHQHHYWGERTEVDVFYKTDVQIQKNPFKGNREGCRTIGHREFNLESDENDAAGLQDPPVNDGATPNPRADVVFAGTSRIDISLLNLDVTVTGAGGQVAETAQLYFLWKPANMNDFQPANGCGVPLKVGEVFSIPVGPGGADPPHQWLVSRWSFKVWVATPNTVAEDLGTMPHVAEGKFGLQMTAVNTGAATLDPAHPDLWEGLDTYDLGCTSQSGVPRQVVVTTNQAEGTFDQAPKEPLVNIEWQFGRIVPLQTEKVTGSLEYSYKGALKGTPLEPTLRILYYGADTNVYAAPDEVARDGAAWTFTVFDREQRKADPPYLDRTQWRFMLLPVNAATDATGGLNIADFEGDFTMCFTAHKIPGAVVT